MVKENRPHVVKMAIECEQTPSTLIRPNFDLVVISARYKKWLCFVEIDSSDWPIVLLKAVYQSAHAVIP